MSYTSGTTSLKALYIHTAAHLKHQPVHGWIFLKTIQCGTAAPGWQKWVWSPLLAILGSGATGVIYHGRFNAKTYLELLERHQVNVFCCTPTEYRLMAKVEELDKYDLSALHSAVSAGEPLNREVIDVFRKHFGIKVRDGY